MALPSDGSMSSLPLDVRDVAMLDEPLQKLALDGQKMETAQQVLFVCCT